MTEKPNKKSAGQPPVSAHPAFPVIVAVWFAALLAIGSLVLPLAMFESLAISSGLADSFAAAQPPLATGARIAVAIVAAMLGALLGVFVARKVAAATARGPLARSAGASRFSPKRPISAHDELDEEGIDALEIAIDTPDESFAARRRALAATNENAHSEVFDIAPLPGKPVDLAEEPLDLMRFEQAGTEDAETTFQAEVPAFVPDLSETPARDDEPVRQEQGESCASGRPVASPVADRPLGELGMVELVERFAIALQRHRERAGETPAAGPAVREAPQAFSRAQVEADPAQRQAPPHHALPASLRPFAFDEEPGADDGESGDARGYDFAATPSFNHDALPAGPEWGDVPGEAEGENAFEDQFDETAEAEYTSLLSMKSSPGQSREPVRIDQLEEADDGESGPVVVFPGQTSRRPEPAFAGDAAPVFDEDDSVRAFDAPLARAAQAAAGATYASTAGRRPASPANAEQALREALERLQRMSGAA